MTCSKLVMHLGFMHLAIPIILSGTSTTLLFNHFIVLDNIQLCIRSHKCNPVNIIIFKKLFGNLYYCLPSKLLAFKIRPESYLVINAIQTKDLNYFKKIFRRYMINYSSILNCTDDSFVLLLSLFRPFLILFLISDIVSPDV